MNMQKQYRHRDCGFPTISLKTIKYLHSSMTKNVTSPLKPSFISYITHNVIGVRMINQILLGFVVAAVFVSIPAHSQNGRILETCELRGPLRLEADTIITCSDTLRIETGGRIITQGYNLRLDTGILDIADTFEVRAFAEANPNRRSSDSSEISISARSCIGKIEIDNRPLTENGLGGDVTIECLTSLEYDHSVQLGRAATVTFLRNGDPEALIGALYRPAQ
jgi:hypothetical protein